MLRSAVYVTSGVGLCTLVVVLFLFYRMLYRMVYNISIPQRVVIVDDRAKND